MPPKGRSLCLTVRAWASSAWNISAEIMLTSSMIITCHHITATSPLTTSGVQVKQLVD